MERFLDAYLYVARHMVTQQQFEVEVWRSPVNDEDRKEIVARQRLHWGDRRPSPRDLCNMMRDGHHEDTIMNFLSHCTGNTANDRLEQWLKTPYAGLPRLAEGVTPLPGTLESDPVTKSTHVTHIFTRNEQDGFANEEELTPEVDPPQECTPLHTNIVYGRNRDLYDTTSKKKKPKKGAEANGTTVAAATAFYVMLAIGDAKFHSERTPSWGGTEAVLLTLRELSDGQFVAKPSLNQLHVLAITDDVMWSYRIGLVVDNVRAAVSSDPTNMTTHQLVGEKISTVIGEGASSDPTALDDMERRATVLRQLVASAAGPALTTGGSTTAIPGSTFTIPPSDKNLQRVHYFGTVDRIHDIDHDAVFIDCEFIIPQAGYTIDTDVNHKCGVKHHPYVFSQTALASRYLNTDMMYTTTHHFNMPFEMHCAAEVLTPTAPRLVISVWSVEGDRKQTLRGYGVVTLSPFPGQYKATVGLWRPSLQGRETIHSLFVGGSASLVSGEDAAIPYQRRADNLRALSEVIDFNSAPASLAVANRAGLITESQGKVEVTWMCATQRRYTKNDDAIRSRLAAGSR